MAESELLGSFPRRAWEDALEQFREEESKEGVILGSISESASSEFIPLGRDWLSFSRTSQP